VTSTEGPVAIWRCGSCENRRGALVVLLHGRGADERDLFPLNELVPDEAAVASLRGPRRVGEGLAW
jgi:phospholipase/carboxylesterase